MKLVFGCSQGFVVDLVQDIRRVNDEAMKARKTGVIVLGCLVADLDLINIQLCSNSNSIKCFMKP